MNRHRQTLVILTLCMISLAGPLTHNVRAIRARDKLQGHIWSAPNIARGEVLRLLALGHEEFVADLFWLRAIQYYGDEGNRAVYYADLHKYLDAANLLDPNFYQPYLFGGIVVPYHRGGGVWENVEASNEILERAVRKFPDDAFLWMQLGFNYSIARGDYRHAAWAYLRAATCSNAPGWMALLASRLYSTEGQFEVAERFLETRIQEIADGPDRDKLERRLKEVRMEKMRRKIEDRAKWFFESKGRWPNGIEELAVADPEVGAIPKEVRRSFRINSSGEVLSDEILGGKLVVHK